MTVGPLPSLNAGQQPADSQPADLPTTAPLRAYGRLVGRFPKIISGVSFALCLGFAIGGWVSCWGRYTSDLPMEKEWSVRGGQLEREYDGFVDSHNDEPWMTKSHVTMFVGKEKGQDLFTPEVFAETEELYGRFFNISVTTTSGKVYTTWDLCDRGSMPDKPADYPPGSCAALAEAVANNATGAQLAQLAQGCAPSPYFPCKILSPNQCFSEYTEYLHPSYTQIDAVVDQVLPASMAALPYLTRPSWKNKTAAEMKRVASKVQLTGSKGCPWYTQLATFTAAMWGAGVEWNADETEMTKVQGMRWVPQMDAPRRVAFRMNLTQPDKAVEKEVTEALLLHQNVWQEQVEHFASTAKLVEVSNLKPDFMDEVEEELKRPPWLLIIIGGVIMAALVACVFVSFTQPLASKVTLGLMGLQAVGISVVSTGGLILVAGFQFNAAMMAALPFLGLGLGMNDAFVLIRYFSDLGVEYISENETPEIIGEVFAKAGAGVLLTSVCNSVAFGLGSLLPVPGMSNFCIGASLVSAVNFFVIVTQFLASLVLEVHRIKTKQPEPACFFCHRRALARETTVNSQCMSLEERFNTFLEKKAAPSIVKLPVMIGLASIAFAFLAVACVFVADKSVGYSPAEIVPRHMHEHHAMNMLFDWFSFFPAQVVFKDVDVPNNQVEMLKLYEAVTDTKFAIPDPAPLYLTMHYNYLAAVGAVMNMTLLDASWTHPVLAPYGIGSSDPTEFYQWYHQWSSFPFGEPAKAYQPGGDTFVYADMVRTNEFNHYDGATKELEMSFFPFYQVNIKDNEAILQSIRKIRNAIANSSLGKEGKAFVHGDIFTYWQVFLEIDGVLWRVLGVNLAVIFAVALLLLRSPLAAIVTAVACAMIVLELYGICMLFLKFNIFIAATVLAGAGMSVEFIAHTVAAFVQETGTLEQRLGKSMKHTFMAIVLGSASTFLGILPIAFHPVPFVLKYQFVPFALAVAIGTFIGMVFLPAFLALIGTLQEHLQRCRPIKTTELPKKTTDATELGRTDFDETEGAI